jgi:predicted metal-dependent hydrolase
MFKRQSNMAQPKNVFNDVEKWIQQRERKIRNMAKLRAILGVGEPFELSWEKQFINVTEYLKDLLNDAKSEITQKQGSKR